jgi:hypothetical protein
MKKKISLVTALVLLLGVCAPLGAGNVDFILMVDTSTSMFPYFDDILNYIVHDFLTAQLHAGDTIHLLSFASTPEEEIALAMGTEDSAEKAFGRVLLLQPLGRYTDLVAALQFLYRYARELPEKNPKSILLITDGVHDPPANSPNRGAGEQIGRLVEQATTAIKNEDWTFHILKVPPEPAPGEEGLPSYLPQISEILGVPVVPYKTGERTNATVEVMGFPALEFPPPLGKVGSRFRAPFRVKNFGDAPIILKLSSVRSEGIELLDGTVAITLASRQEAPLDVPVRLPYSLAQGDYSRIVDLTFEGDTRISPTSGTLQFTYTGGASFFLGRATLLSILYVVLAAAAVFLLVILFLSMRKRFREVQAAGVGKAVGRKEAIGPAETAPGRAEEAAAASPAAVKRGYAPKKPAVLKMTLPLAEKRSETAKTAAPPAAPLPLRGKKHIPLMEAGSARERSVAPHPAAPKRPSVESLRRSLPEPSRVPSALPPLIEMRLSGQNSRIGFRNIHRIASGGTRTVGGRYSAYLVFLARVPQRIAEIRNAAGKYTFYIQRSEYFPGISHPIADCLGVEIPLTMPKGTVFTMRFHEWVSPLEEINALMRSAHS